jgi:uncharacterized protein (DUF302 family)
VSYYLRRRIEGGDFPAVVAAIREALSQEGFGVLTEIDVQATLRERLGEEVTPYLILGACNPPLAHRAISAEPEVGVLLPCNVVVRAEDGAVVVDAMDPTAVLSLVESPAVGAVAGDVRARLERALAAL